MWYIDILINMAGTGVVYIHATVPDISVVLNILAAWNVLLMIQRLYYYVLEPCQDA